MGVKRGKGRAGGRGREEREMGVKGRARTDRKEKLFREKRRGEKINEI